MLTTCQSHSLSEFRQRGSTSRQGSPLLRKRCSAACLGRKSSVDLFLTNMVVAMHLSGLSGKVCVPARPSASFAGRRVAAPTNGCKVFAKKEGSWLPGADTPAYLDELPAYVSGSPCPCTAASNPNTGQSVRTEHEQRHSHMIDMQIIRL